MKMMKRMVLLAILMVMATATAFAQPILRMPAILSDHMVLQEQSTVTIWGWADPNCTVTVTPSWGEAVQTKSHYDTSWAVKIQTPAATAEAQSIVIKTNKKAEETIEDILIGQVWLCSGQSNMNWSAVHGSADMKQALEGEQYPQMRLFTVTKNCTGNLQADCDGEWIVCGDEETKYFSAVGYFFGRHLFEKLNRPVGLINSSWGGTPIEMWMAANDAKQNKEAYDLFVKRYAKRSGWRAGGLYGAMIHPLRNFEIAGAIWYQGCANAYNPEVYGEQQALMIHTWRKAFGQPDMPFYMVQLAPHGREAKLGGKTLVREQQDGTKSATLECGVLSMPLESHPD
ncbi:MAG: sialate O-acetylesterase, partial [Alistipes sp.]|nr:sialate O-acetylesterase [Alistipes sp.]